MKLIVTGGAGFIGSHFVGRCLEDRHEVTVIDDFNDFYAPEIKRANLRDLLPHIHVFETDIRNADEITKIVKNQRPDAIVHLAARAGVRPSIKEPKLYIDTNITGTFNLLEAAKLADVPRFVFASSSSVYGVLKTAPFREDMCLNQTISPYAATKLASEQLCSNYAHIYGLRSVSLRFFTVYGPRQRPDLAIHSFCRAILEGRTIQQFGDGSTRRDYTYVDDILQGLTAALGYQGPICDVFNIGESQTTTLRDLIIALEKVLGRSARIEILPEQPGDVPLTYADISKARELLGYRPHTPISEGIPRFVEWLLQSRSNS
jgi:UDP-glucuronate 4-epimerase